MEKVVVLSEEEAKVLLSYLEDKELNEEILSIYKDLLDRYYLLKGIVK